MQVLFYIFFLVYVGMNAHLAHQEGVLAVPVYS